jgi:acetoin utilization deacetylase AcuC-like enzyme
MTYMPHHWKSLGLLRWIRLIVVKPCQEHGHEAGFFNRAGAPLKAASCIISMFAMTFRLNLQISRRTLNSCTDRNDAETKDLLKLFAAAHRGLPRRIACRSRVWQRLRQRLRNAKTKVLTFKTSQLAMSKISFATYLHPQIALTSRPPDQVNWFGHSYPHYAAVGVGLAEALSHYAALPVRRVELSEYASVHSPDYLDQLKQMAAGTLVGARPEWSGECSGFEHCLPGYEYSLGGMFEAVDQMSRGILDRAYCMSLGGHHAHVDWGHGYCILNPQAVATRYAQKRGFKRILFVDWDIHHGDGTQAIFANDPTVYCISIHSFIDLYMMKASNMLEGSTAAAEAVGHKNIPVLHTVFSDDFVTELKLPGKFYRASASLPVFQQALQELPWMPDLICICSGYDSHAEDCGADVTGWQDQDFRHLTNMVVAVANRAGCPILSVHAGGYNLPVTIRAAVVHAQSLAR